MAGYVFLCIYVWQDMCVYVFRGARICVCMYLGVPGYVFVLELLSRILNSLIKVGYPSRFKSL